MWQKQLVVVVVVLLLLLLLLLLPGMKTTALGWRLLVRLQLSWVGLPLCRMVALMQQQPRQQGWQQWQQQGWQQVLSKQQLSQTQHSQQLEQSVRPLPTSSGAAAQQQQQQRDGGRASAKLLASPSSQGPGV